MSKCSSSRLLVSAIGVSFGIILLLSYSACSSRRTPPPPRDIAPKHSGVKPIAHKQVIPPWQYWGNDSLGDPNIQKGDELVREGQLEAAVDTYALTERLATSAELREASLLRRSGTLLKLGRSQEALESVTNYYREGGLTPDDINPQTAMVVAFAYLHQGNLDQNLAWLGAVRTRAGARSELGYRAEREVKRVIRSIPVENFAAAEQKWSGDPFIAPLFSAENARRSLGAVPETHEYGEWFVKTTYLPQTTPTNLAEGGIVESDLAPPLGAATYNSDHATIGLLLPLSGRFAEHGKRVKEGIELALEEFTTSEGQIQVAVADTEGDADVAASAYANLVQREKVSFVMGPLLVKTAMSVAEQSNSLKIPLLTFTKREGIPQLSPVVFRLGATARDQVAELIEYATKTIGVTSFAIMYPTTETGEELFHAFKGELAERKLALAAEASYVQGDQDSLNSAIGQIESTAVQALFIAEAVETIWPILELIKSSPLRNVAVLGPASWDDPVAIRGYASLLENAVYVTPFFSSSPDPQIREFVDKFKAKFGHEPGLLGAQGYDAMRLVLSVFKSGDYAPNAIIKGLEGVDSYDGVTGRLRIAPNHEISRRMSVIRLIRGNPTEVVIRGEPTGVLLDEETNNVGAVQ